ncbi:MAG: NADH-ubiquinone oxidoreductase-F iron-sulfur binding region domain-containing protein [Patescibacteria group bacterium]|nr:NADH-ubiquinone oxidoreductase-F iron-sulfur binding region domain-containing protein [Patescibacteria group bacterium]
MDILSKIKKANLVGRGGAGFPTAKKWSSVAKALEDKEAGEGKSYVVCNASEGEPGVMKDGYILEHYADRVIDGIKIAIDFLLAEKGYLFLNHSYYKKLNKTLTPFLKDSKIEIFIKPINAGYIGGEESAILNAIEGRRIEPRLKPPFPTAKGLWGYPTLINNVETFYNVSLAASGDYKNKRFYTITGDCPFEGVYELPDNLIIEKLLNQTKNYPKFPFFAVVGGSASGEALNSSQLKRQVSGAGSIAIYSLAKNNFKKAIKSWLDFFVNESCGQCTPCREGVYRLQEIFMKEKIDWPMFNSLLDNLSDTSICALGSSVATTMKSFIKNVHPRINEKN